MTSIAFRCLAWLTLLMTAGLLLATACDGGDSVPSAPSPAATATRDAVAGPTVPSGVTIETPSFGEGLFGREPLEEPGDTAQPAPLLIDLQAGTPADYDRVLLQFEGGIPGYRIEYVSPPIAACGSGLPVEVAGDAFLRVRMSPAAAHDDAGVPTFDQYELAPNLPVLLEIEQTCDFEGELTWVLGLTEEVDFRVSGLMEALLVLDVHHP